MKTSSSMEINIALILLQVSTKKFFWNASVEEYQDKFKPANVGNITSPPSANVAGNKRYREKKGNVAKDKLSIVVNSIP